MLVALSKVPHLAMACADFNVLKELRSICTEARLLGSGAVTGLTLDLNHGVLKDFNACDLRSMLSTSRLQRIRVILHPDAIGELVGQANG